MNSNETTPIRHRLGALLYDALICITLMMSVSALLYLVPLTQNVPNEHKHLYQIILLTTNFLYFMYFFKKTGQSIGMKTWRIKLITTDGKPLTYQRIFLRLLCALPSIFMCGIGLFMILFHPKKQALHDMLSNTTLTTVRDCSPSYMTTGPTS